MILGGGIQVEGVVLVAYLCVQTNNTLYSCRDLSDNNNKENRC